MKNAKFIVFLTIALLAFSSLVYAQTVTFQVNMTVKQAEGTFNPATDIVDVRGSFNDWSGGDELTDDDSDGIYTLGVDFSTVTDDTVYYKFTIVDDDGNVTWEDNVEDNIGGNRYFEYGGSDMELDVVYFDDDDVSDVTLPFKVFFRVDMSVQELTGNFDPGSGEEVGLRGNIAEFGSWGATQVFSPEPGNPGVYQALISIPSYPIGSTLAFKYVIDRTDDTVTWEDGDDRTFSMTMDDTTVVDPNDGFYIYEYEPDNPDCVYFNCATAEDFLQQDVEVTFRVDISSAITYLNENPDSCLIDVQAPDLSPICDPEEINSVYINGNFANWWGWGEVPPEYEMTETTDNIWEWTHEFPAGTAKSIVYKYGLNSYDNEAGFGQDHVGLLSDENPTFVIENCFGSTRTDIDPWPECNTFVSVEDDADNVAILPQFELYQNRPNPFNPSTTIAYQLEARSHVTLDIYNVAGQMVRTFDLGQQDPSIVHNVVWDGRDNNGNDVVSGVYFYRLNTDNHSQARKMILLK